MCHPQNPAQVWLRFGGEARSGITALAPGQIGPSWRALCCDSPKLTGRRWFAPPGSGAECDLGLGLAGGESDGDSALVGRQERNVVVAVIGRQNALACGGVFKSELDQDGRGWTGVLDGDMALALARDAAAEVVSVAGGSSTVPIGLKPDSEFAGNRLRSRDLLNSLPLEPGERVPRIPRPLSVFNRSAKTNFIPCKKRGASLTRSRTRQKIRVGGCLIYRINCCGPESESVAGRLRPAGE